MTLIVKFELIIYILNKKKLHFSARLFLTSLFDVKLLHLILYKMTTFCLTVFSSFVLSIKSNKQIRPASCPLKREPTKSDMRIFKFTKLWSKLNLTSLSLRGY